MDFLNRLTPWLAAVMTFIIFELLISQPKQIFWLVPLAMLVIFLAVWQLTGREFRKARLWNFLITPLALLSGGWLFLAFLEGRWFRQIFLLILVFGLWLFLEVIFLYFFFRPKYQAHALENISSYLNLMAFFLIFSGFFSLSIFLGFPSWFLGIISVVVVGFLTYQLFWVSNIPTVSAWPYLVIITLITEELFLATRFLPTSVYVNSLIITSAYYLLSGLARNWLLGIQEIKVIKRYLIITFICLVIILITAKWV